MVSRWGSYQKHISITYVSFSAWLRQRTFKEWYPKSAPSQPNLDFYRPPSPRWILRTNKNQFVTFKYSLDMCWVWNLLIYECQMQLVCNLCEKTSFQQLFSASFSNQKTLIFDKRNASSMWNSFNYELLTIFCVQNSFFGILNLDISPAWKLWNFEWG